jgi:hypothetical protein
MRAGHHIGTRGIAAGDVGDDVVRLGVGVVEMDDILDLDRRRRALLGEAREAAIILRRDLDAGDLLGLAAPNR